MSGMYDDNTYFNNPVDYLSNLSDPWILWPARPVRYPYRHGQRAVGEQRTVVPALKDFGG